MPDWEMSWLKNIMSSDARPEQASMHYQLKHHDIQQRLNLLFGPSDFDKVDEESKQAEGKMNAQDKATADAGYKTVNEGATTDTQLDSDYVKEAEEMSKSQGDMKPKKMKLVRIRKKKQGDFFNSGIKSDDEDEKQQDDESEYEEVLVEQSGSESDQEQLKAK